MGRAVKHKGEPVRLMSGEHGTLIVEDGDAYPSWYTPQVEAVEETETKESD